MEEMQKPVENKPVMPSAKPMVPGKKKSNYLIPVIVSFVAVAAFLLVWYFAVN